jgi:hypothetical protein
MLDRVLENGREKHMSKLFFKASCAAVFLVVSQFALAQCSTTDIEAHPLVTQTTAQPRGSATSESSHANDARQPRNDESEGAAGGGASPVQGGEAKLEGWVYPRAGTTINGLPVHLRAPIKIGDRVQTGEAIGSLTVKSVSLDLGLNTVVSIQEPLILNCGVIFVRSGTIAINDANNTFSFTTGQTAYAASTSCESGLPDSPGAVRTDGQKTPHGKSRTSAQMTATGGWLFDGRIIDRSFVVVNGVMLGSSVVAAELTQRCLQARACTDVPDAFRSRAAMYGAGLPAAAGVAYLGYYLKSKGYRWWFVPAAIVTVGNVIVSTHAAHFSR